MAFDYSCEISTADVVCVEMGRDYMSPFWKK